MGSGWQRAEGSASLEGGRLSAPEWGLIMDDMGRGNADGMHDRLERMRARARELEADAEQAGSAEERRRLQGEVEKLEMDSEQESMMAAGDIYPCE